VAVCFSYFIPPLPRYASDIKSVGGVGGGRAVVMRVAAEVLVVWAMLGTMSVAF
jgi:hypothetical protein